MRETTEEWNTAEHIHIPHLWRNPCQVSISTGSCPSGGGGGERFVWEVATEQGEPARAHSSVSKQPASLLFVVPRVRSTCGGGVEVGGGVERHPGHYESSGSAWASKVWTQKQQSSEPPISPICYLANHNLHLLSTCHVNLWFARWNFSSYCRKIFQCLIKTLK